MYKEIVFSAMQLKEPNGQRIITPNEVYELLKDLSLCAQEQFVVLTINTKNRLIDRHMIALGTVSSTLIHPREVFRPAITDSASQIIVAHNHPSGDPSPSAEDIRITRKLIEAGKVVGIEVMDHIIIGRPNKNGGCGWLSLRESGLCTFD